jgi:hypothetical protein
MKLRSFCLFSILLLHFFLLFLLLDNQSLLFPNSTSATEKEQNYHEHYKSEEANRPDDGIGGKAISQDPKQEADHDSE